MKTSQYLYPSAFYSKVRELLEENEALNNYLIGTLLRLGKGEHAGKAYEEDKLRMLLVEEEGRAVACGIQAPPQQIMLYTSPGKEGAALSMVDFYKARGWDFTGLIGEERSIEVFRGAWGGAWGPVHVSIAYQLHSTQPPRPVPGQYRKATEEDRALVLDWFGKFMVEALGDWNGGTPRNPEVEERIVDRTLGQGHFYIWEDGSPQCMAAYSRPMERGICISHVYTPLENRGKGYASNLVHAMSRQALGEGYQWLALFADGANPSSNKIYQRIGYREAGRSAIQLKQ